MNLRLVVSFFLLLVLASLSLSPSAHAECVPIYGGGQSCTSPTLSLIKTVFNPVSSTYVHDLGLNDTRFHPGDQVSFRITVTNTGNGNATNVVVTDFLPSSLIPIAPTADAANSSTVTFHTDTIGPGESVTFTVVGQVIATLPQSLFCMSNEAQATSQQDTNTATDFSQFCMEQVVSPTGSQTQTITPATIVPTIFPPTPTTTLPPTGPEALPLLALFPTGITGVILRKIAQKLQHGPSFQHKKYTR